MEDILVSVIVPFYNTKRDYLIQCIDSILTQSYKNLELLIINDGSTDPSLDSECQNYKLKDVRVIYISNKINCGVSDFRNIGLNIAKGNFISFVDSDDWLERDIYKILLNVVKINKVDTVFYNHYKYIDGKKEIVNRSLENQYEFFSFENKLVYYFVTTSEFNGPCYTLYSKKIIDENNIRFPVGMKMGEDFIFNSIYYSHSKYGKLCENYLYNYRLNFVSTTNIFDIAIFNNTGIGYYKRLNLIEKYLINSDYYDKAMNVINYNYVRVIFRFVYSALSVGIQKKLIVECLESSWSKDVIEKKSIKKSTAALKLLLKYKCFRLIKALCNIRRILVSQGYLYRN